MGNVGAEGIPMTADRAVFAFTVASTLVVFGMGIGEERAMQDLAVKCLPQPGESRLLAVVQTTKPQPTITCVFEYAPPARATIKRRAT